MLGRQAKGRGRRVEIPKSGSGGFREFRGNELGEGVGLNSRGAFRWNSGGRRGREGRNSAERGEGNRRRAGCAGVRWKGKFQGIGVERDCSRAREGFRMGLEGRDPVRQRIRQRLRGNGEELLQASGFCGRRVGFLRGSGLNSADWRRGAEIRIRGVRTSRLLISRFELESRSLASIPTASEGSCGGIIGNMTGRLWN